MVTVRNIFQAKRDSLLAASHSPNLFVYSSVCLCICFFSMCIYVFVCMCTCLSVRPFVLSCVSVYRRINLSVTIIFFFSILMFSFPSVLPTDEFMNRRIACRLKSVRFEHAEDRTSSIFQPIMYVPVYPVMKKLKEYVYMVYQVQSDLFAISVP